MILDHITIYTAVYLLKGDYITGEGINPNFHNYNNENAFINNISHSNANNDRYDEANEPKPWYESGNSWQLAQNLYDDSFILSQDEKNIAEGFRGNTDNLPNTKWLQLKKNINYPNIGYWGEE